METGSDNPNKIRVFPCLSESCRRIGRLVCLPETGYPSEYPKHPERYEPTDGEAIESPEEALEHMIGHQMMFEGIDAAEALGRLDHGPAQ